MSYLGSKAASGAYQAIIALMPPHDTFIDLFAGSGVILSRKQPCCRTIAVDLDPIAVANLPNQPRLEKVHAEARSYLDGFDWAGSGRVLIYADPPYVHSTRTSRNRYRHEMTDEDHLGLLRQLRAVPAKVILSGYPSTLYDANLPGWFTKQFQVMTRGGPRTEQLWFNFTPSAVHWCEYAGENYTDRQRIKRKALRWAANYSALPPAEQLAVLSAIMSADAATGDYSAGHTDAVDHRRRSTQSDDRNHSQPQLCFVAGRCNTLQPTSNLSSGRRATIPQ